MNKIIIGLAGVKTSGKSTVANIVKNLTKNNVEASESALANKLKDVCSEVFNVPRENFDRQDVKEKLFEDGNRFLDLNSISLILNSFKVEVKQSLVDYFQKNNIIGMKLDTPRKIAQIVGTEVLRATGDEDIHCKNMPLNENGITIVSDLRFPNEFEYFYKLAAKGYRFIPFYIQRDEAEKHVTKDSHPSETSVFIFSDKCRKLDNNSTLESLELQIRTVLEDEGIIQRLKTSKRA